MAGRTRHRRHAKKFRYDHFTIVFEPDYTLTAPTRQFSIIRYDPPNRRITLRSFESLLGDTAHAMNAYADQAHARTLPELEQL